MASRVEGAFVFSGAVQFLGNVSFANASISNTHIADNAAIAHTKLEHQHRFVWSTSGTSSSNAGQVMGVIYGATGDALEIKAGSLTACTGDAAYTIQVYKGTISLLTGAITLNSANQHVTGTLIASPTLVSGDIIKVVTTANAGTGSLGTGAYAIASINEDAS